MRRSGRGRCCVVSFFLFGRRVCVVGRWRQKDRSTAAVVPPGKHCDGNAVWPEPACTHMRTDTHTHTNTKQSELVACVEKGRKSSKDIYKNSRK